MQTANAKDYNCLLLVTQVVTAKYRKLVNTPLHNIDITAVAPCTIPGHHWFGVDKQCRPSS